MSAEMALEEETGGESRVWLETQVLESPWRLLTSQTLPESDEGQFARRIARAAGGCTLVAFLTVLGAFCRRCRRPVSLPSRGCKRPSGNSEEPQAIGAEPSRAGPLVTGSFLYL